MNLEVKTRNEIGAEAWNGFVLASDEAWLWHCFDMAELRAAWPDMHDVSFGIIDRDHGGSLVAVVPCFVHARHSMSSIGGPALENRLGRKHRGSVYECIREHLQALAREKRISTVMLSLSPLAPAYTGGNCPLVNPLLSLGCENALTQTLIVDVRKGRDTVWQNMEGRARTAVRKAEKLGVRVREAGMDESDTYYKLHCETYDRTGVPAHPEAFFRKMWEKFLSDGRCRVWFAEYGGRVVAAENFGIFKDRAVYWTGAASRQGLEVCANSLIQWQAIEWMMESGIQWYETGEAFPGIREGKLKGLSDFKQSFGGALFPFYKGIMRIPREETRAELLKRSLAAWIRATRDLLVCGIGLGGDPGRKSSRREGNAGTSAPPMKVRASGEKR
ncbi:MAG: GNAT family N-acetyltransferase [Desulfomonilia bacterium]